MIISSSHLWGDMVQVHEPLMLAKPAESNPCLGSLMAPPSLKGRCMLWQDNVRAIPTFDPARRYIFSGSALHALHVLDADTGQEEARIQLKGRAVTKTLVSPDGKSIFVGTDKGVVSAFDAFSFKHIFDFDADGSINNDLTFKDGRIYFTTSLATIYSLEAITGALVWQMARPMLRDRLKLSSQSNILFDEQSFGDKKSVNLIVPHPDGYLSLISAKDGTFLHKISVTQGQTSFPDIVAPMIMTSDLLWVASYDAGLFGIDLITKQVRQTIAVPAIVQLALFGETLIVATTDSLLAIHVNGKIVWKNEYSQLRSRRDRYAYPFKSLEVVGKRIFYGTPSLLILGNKVTMATSMGAMGTFDLANGRLIGLSGVGLGFGPGLETVDGRVLAITQSGSSVIFKGL